MKKLFALAIALMMALCCVGVLAEDQVGVYTIYNKTGETVTELTITDNVSGEVSENFAGEGLAADAKIEVTMTLPEGEDGHHRYTLTFKTEGGYEGVFATLSNEVAPITLLAADAMTGATQINFFVPSQVGVYTIYNKTGETVTELTITDNVSGEVSENFAGEGLAADAVVEATMKLSVEEDGHHRYTLAFKTEGGYEGVFATLSNEVAPITLLSADAMTGATQINFFVPKQVGIYTVYNKTGEKVTELTITDNVTGEVSENFAGEGLDADAVIEVKMELPADQDAHHRYTLTFKTEGGYEGVFATLSNEVAPITLLAADAMTGATPITFFAPQE